MVELKIDLKQFPLNRLGAVVAWYGKETGMPYLSSWVGDTKDVLVVFTKNKIPSMHLMRKNMEIAYDVPDALIRHLKYPLGTINEGMDLVHVICFLKPAPN